MENDYIKVRKSKEEDFEGAIKLEELELLEKIEWVWFDNHDKATIEKDWTWLREHKIGDPKPTTLWTVDELKARGVVGVYIKKVWTKGE